MSERPELKDMTDLVEAVAEAIHDSMFEERFTDLHENGIDKAMARRQAVAALTAVADFGDARLIPHAPARDERYGE